MKYALIFVATAAANEAYGGYGAHVESSSVVKPSTSSKPAGYTTIVPGYGKEPVTVTTQHQPYPTCVSPAYGGKDCAKWEEDAYVSTVIKDYDNNYATITKTAQPVVVYHTKKTITHSATATGGYAAPTGYANKNGTDGCWYELYEKIEEVPYNQLGPHALPGYPGSGLYKGGETKQPVHVKEYKGGKWTEYEQEHSYDSPKPEVTTYEKPGVYTVPSKDVTIDHPVTYPAEATKTAKAGETCTYGGQYIEAKQTGYITAAYGAYETKVNGDKTVTETVIKHTTIYASTTGNYEVAKPTTTVYDHDTEVAYPTAQHYEPGVYHHEAKTVTVTKPGQAYTCEYEQTKKYEATYTPKKPTDHEAYPTSAPVHDNSYGYDKPSATPYKPTEGEKYPSYPAGPKEGYPSSVQESYPASTPVAVYSKPSYNGGNDYGYHGNSSMTVSSKEYPHAESTPAYGTDSYPESTPAHGTDSYPESTPAYGTDSYPVASSTPCESSSAYVTHATSAAYGAYTPVAVHSKPSYNGDNAYGENVKSTLSTISTKAYPESTPVEHYPASASSTPCESSTSSVYYNNAYSQATPYPAKSSAYNTEAYGQPSSTPVYDNTHYPADATSTPCESDKPSATPVAYQSAPAANYGYTKRSGMNQRRNMVAAQ
jgi:hypothetical protein